MIEDSKNAELPAKTEATFVVAVSSHVISIVRHLLSWREMMLL